MYKDPKRWSYLFQSYVLLTMMEAHETPQTRPMRILERSVYSARFCFIENLRKCDPPVIDEVEYQVYQRWFDWLMAHHRPHVDLIGLSPCSASLCLLQNVAPLFFLLFFLLFFIKNKIKQTKRT